ncbi:MAG: hypothetical protein EPO65_10970 [Dehalococcoidia bacterium]|nr:MAG: hypothetical protein EPO65_10970 [Dehalococcoidia bacterium]
MNGSRPSTAESCTTVSTTPSSSTSLESFAPSASVRAIPHRPSCLGARGAPGRSDGTGGGGDVRGVSGSGRVSDCAGPGVLLFQRRGYQIMNQTSERAQNVAESIDAAVQQYCEERDLFDTVTKGDGFAIWCLTDVFGFEKDDAIDALTGAKGDHSMDAIADDGNRLIVLQAKYHSQDWSEVTKFQTDARSVGAGTARLPQALRAPATKIRARRESGLPIEYFYITNDRFTGDDVVKIANLGEDPEIRVLDLDGICDLLFERESQRPVNVPAQPAVIHPRIKPLQFADSLVFPVSLREFSRFVSEDGKDRWLFNSNVRQYLSRSKINEGIRETAKTSPESFWRYNNGVTIVVDDFEVRSDSLALKKPQIVNGCQTSLALVKVMAEMTPSEQEKVEGDLLVRVLREPRDDERERITQFTNKQNAVKGKDFYALQDFQKQLKTRIGRLGYFYEIQTGSYDMLSRSAKEALRGESRFSHLQWKRKDYRIPAIEAAKCHAAAFRSKVAAC